MIKKQTLRKIISWSFALFFLSLFTLLFYIFLKANPPVLIFYISITSFGVGIVSLVLDKFLSLKDSDLDYFKNIMVGVSGGLAVWVLSEIDFSFKEGFWLTVNGFLLRAGVAMMIIIIGYRIYKKNE